MSSISNNLNVKRKDVANLNTTIERSVLNEFKINCKQIGVPMNTLIEAFMRQYNEGGFYLKFGRENKQIDVELDKKEYSK